jgi:hypothetical protein
MLCNQTQIELTSVGQAMAAKNSFDCCATFSQAARVAPNDDQAEFVRTYWSVVLRARASQAPETAQAPDSLCVGYGYPLSEKDPEAERTELLAALGG